jgi:hypothetical protein
MQHHQNAYGRFGALDCNSDMKLHTWGIGMLHTTTVHFLAWHGGKMTKILTCDFMAILLCQTKGKSRGIEGIFLFFCKVASLAILD